MVRKRPRRGAGVFRPLAAADARLPRNISRHARSDRLFAAVDHRALVANGIVDVRDELEAVLVSIAGSGIILKIMDMAVANGICAAGAPGILVEMPFIGIGAEHYFMHMIARADGNRLVRNCGKTVVVRIVACFSNHHAALHLVQVGVFARTTIHIPFHNHTSFLMLWDFGALFILCVRREAVRKNTPKVSGDYPKELREQHHFMNEQHR